PDTPSWATASAATCSLPSAYRSVSDCFALPFRQMALLGIFGGRHEADTWCVPEQEDAAAVITDERDRERRSATAQHGVDDTADRPDYRGIACHRRDTAAPRCGGGAVGKGRRGFRNSDANGGRWGGRRGPTSGGRGVGDGAPRRGGGRLRPHGGRAHTA